MGGGIWFVCGFCSTFAENFWGRRVIGVWGLGKSRNGKMKLLKSFIKDKFINNKTPTGGYRRKNSMNERYKTFDEAIFFQPMPRFGIPVRYLCTLN
jgi:hypothetical protein